MIPPLPTPIVDAQETVPHSLLPTCSVTLERVSAPRPLLLPITAIGLWFMPRRFGVRLAAAGWRPAILAAVLGWVVGFGILSHGLLVTTGYGAGSPAVFTFHMPPPRAQFTYSERLRAPFAALVTIIHGMTSQRTGGGRGAGTLVYVPVLVVLLSGMCLMPFAAAGERLGLLFSRCMRLVLWSMLMLIPFCIGWTVVVYFRSANTDTNVSSPAEPVTSLPTEPQLLWPLAAAGTLMFLWWWLRVLRRAASRYAGPPDGPGWREVVPQCVKCGYIIAGIAVSSCCPECATPVRHSLFHVERQMRFTRWTAFKAALHAAMVQWRRDPQARGE